MIRMLGLAAAVALLGGAAHAQAACENLTGMAIPASAIGLKTGGAVVAKAESHKLPNSQDAYCQVNGAIRPVDPKAPDINFQVNLPSNWNGKALHFGGAGYDGSLVTGLTGPSGPPGTPSALARGYVTFGSDSGHQTGPGQDPAGFSSNAEALRNFGGEQLKKTHDVAMAVTKRLYGKAPTRTYFHGGSQGGHEAFLVVQRWPKDYDGVIALYPVYDFTAVQTNGVMLGQIIYRSPGSWISPVKANMVAERVMAACDGLDGLKDGVISNVAGCRASFQPKSLLCAGAASDGCLTPEELGTFEAFTVERPFGVTLSGVDRFAPWPVFEGANLAGRFGFGGSAIAGAPPKASDAFIYYMGDQGIRLMALKDPAFDSRKFVPAEHAAALQASSKNADASDPDISAFRARGGKLIILHGTLDTAVSPHNTTAYVERLQKRFGAGLSSFVRYYLVPGFGHGAGAFSPGWDSLGVLEAWVEKGQAPGQLKAVDLTPATAGRERPLCEYPTWPKYKGAGDPKSAASFECVR